MIYKDFNKYIHNEKLMLIITPMDIEGAVKFKLKEDSLIIINKKNTYVLRYIGQKAVDIIQQENGLLVETGNGRLVAEYSIILS